MYKKLKIITFIFLLTTLILKAQESSKLWVSAYLGGGKDSFVSKKYKMEGRSTRSQYVDNRTTNGQHFQLGFQALAPISTNFILAIDASAGATKNNFNYSISFTDGMGYSAKSTYSYSDLLAYEQISILPQLTGNKKISPYFALGPFLGFQQTISTKGEQQVHSVNYSYPNTTVKDTIYKNDEIKTRYKPELGLNACLGLKLQLSNCLFFVEIRTNKSFAVYAETPRLAAYHSSINIGICKALKIQ